MDKRTLLFIVCVGAAFFLIQLFFQRQNQEEQERWNRQQNERRAQRVSQLEAEIAERQVKKEDLPLVELYADAQGNQFLTTAFLDNQSILVPSWQNEAPNHVYGRKFGASTAPEEYHLVAAPKGTSLLIYASGLPEKLQVGSLPDFGKFDLLLLSFNPQQLKDPVHIYAADYNDGHFSILEARIQKLKEEMADSGSPTSKIANGIVVRKAASGYLPVALYDGKELTYLDEIEGIKVAEKKEGEATPQTTEERFYVLENEYQQLVFSNFGAALVEINLPFVSETNSRSVVRPIEFDREMVAQAPYNARFPGHPFYTAGAKPEGPFEEHIEGKLGGYYPLIRRDLIQQPRSQQVRVPPRFYALNIVSEYPEVAEQVYQVKQFDKQSITFESVQSHRRIKKTYSIAVGEKGAPYCLELTIQIEGEGRGLWITSGVPDVELISGSPAPSLKYRLTRNRRAEVEPIDLPKDALTNTSVYPDWISNSNGFLGVILNPISQIDAGFRAQYVSGTLVPSRLVAIDSQFERFKAQDFPGYMTLLPLNSKGGTIQFHVFAGPFADDILRAVDRFYSDPATGYSPDFISSQTFHGWFSFISEPFAKFLYVVMEFFYRLTHSWAISIILLTVFLRLLLYPLNAWSTKSMLRMQQIAPEVTAIQEKYKKDPKKAQLEIMQLYRDRKINPMSGCLPLLIQMPFLIGMFDLLKSTFLSPWSQLYSWLDRQSDRSRCTLQLENAHLFHRQSVSSPAHYFGTGDVLPTADDVNITKRSEPLD